VVSEATLYSFSDRRRLKWTFAMSFREALLAALSANDECSNPNDESCSADKVAPKSTPLMLCRPFCLPPPPPPPKQPAKLALRPPLPPLPPLFGSPSSSTVSHVLFDLKMPPKNSVEVDLAIELSFGLADPPGVRLSPSRMVGEAAPAAPPGLLRCCTRTTPPFPRFRPAPPVGDGVEALTYPSPSPSAPRGDEVSNGNIESAEIEAAAAFEAAAADTDDEAAAAAAATAGGGGFGFGGGGGVSAGWYFLWSTSGRKFSPFLLKETME
jgi:hypothetical protein